MRERGLQKGKKGRRRTGNDGCRKKKIFGLDFDRTKSQGGWEWMGFRLSKNLTTHNGAVKKGRGAKSVAQGSTEACVGGEGLILDIGSLGSATATTNNPTEYWGARSASSERGGWM